MQNLRLDASESLRKKAERAKQSVLSRIWPYSATTLAAGLSSTAVDSLTYDRGAFAVCVIAVAGMIHKTVQILEAREDVKNQFGGSEYAEKATEVYYKLHDQPQIIAWPMVMRIYKLADANPVTLESFSEQRKLLKTIEELYAVQQQEDKLLSGEPLDYTADAQVYLDQAKQRLPKPEPKPVHKPSMIRRPPPLQKPAVDPILLKTTAEIKRLEKRLADAEARTKRQAALSARVDTQYDYMTGSYTTIIKLPDGRTLAVKNGKVTYE